MDRFNELSVSGFERSFNSNSLILTGVREAEKRKARI